MLNGGKRPGHSGGGGGGIWRLRHAEGTQNFTSVVAEDSSGSWWSARGWVSGAMATKIKTCRPPEFLETGGWGLLAFAPTTSSFLFLLWWHPICVMAPSGEGWESKWGPLLPAALGIHYWLIDFYAAFFRFKAQRKVPLNYNLLSTFTFTTTLR